MLNQNWAMVVEGPTEDEHSWTGARIFFFDDHGQVFDTLEYPNAAQANHALDFNGFTPLNNKPEFEDIAGLPHWPLTESSFSRRTVYSSGEYWRQPPGIELVTQRLLHDLKRFVAAQSPVMEIVLEELWNGRKETHWMWFVFPQLSGLGRSENARTYGIANLEEARNYLNHPDLGLRLHQCFAIVLQHKNLPAEKIFGRVDAKKFCSCATLFHRAAGMEESIFLRALNGFYEGKLDQRTLELLSGASKFQGPH